jgi:hypothetical protein
VSDLQATIEYVLPGFVALKVFYLTGLQTRRTDLELTLWSLLAAAPINIVLDRTTFADPAARLVASLVAAMILGFVGGRAWQALATRNSGLRSSTTRRAWDNVLSRDPAPYVQVWTTGGHVVLGWAEVVALDSAADTLDVYLREPQWVSIETQARVEMAYVEGVLIAESAIELIQVFDPAAGIERPPDALGQEGE